MGSVPWADDVADEADAISGLLLERLGNIDHGIARYLAGLTNLLRTLLHEHFVGSYLHGSLTMGAFCPTRSDIDVIATVRRPLNDVMRDKLRNNVESIPLPTIAHGLDLSMLAADGVGQLTENTCWEAMIQVNRAGRGQTARELERCDALLFVDVALLRQYGIALVGPSIGASSAPANWRLIFRACVENTRVWASRDVYNDPSGGVLSVCRAWRYFEEGVLVSKPQAGEWARSRMAKTAVVDAALAELRGDTSHALADAEVKDFCQSILHLFEGGRLPPWLADRPETRFTGR